MALPTTELGETRKNMYMKKHVLITGASGFLGKHLLSSMLKSGQDYFYVLVRDGKARKAIEQYLQQSPGLPPNRHEFVTGDIERAHCGIDKYTLSELTVKVEEVWHLAASTSFNPAHKAKIESTNLGGTRNIIALSEHCSNLKNFFYVSTAYICGKEQDGIPEGKVVVKAGYKNPYEQSKHACEALVSESNLPWSIIRPSILMGDSQTGGAEGENRMVYGYLLAIYGAAVIELGGENAFWDSWYKTQSPKDYMDLNIRLTGSRDVTKNLVTLDDAARVCLAVRKASDPIKKTYNLTNPENISVGEIIDIMQDALHIKGIQYVPQLGATDLDKNRAETFAYKCLRPYHPYVSIKEPRWETMNVNELGVRRIVMTGAVCRFLIERFVEENLMKKNNGLLEAEKSWIEAKDSLVENAF